MPKTSPALFAPRHLAGALVVLSLLAALIALAIGSIAAPVVKTPEAEKLISAPASQAFPAEAAQALPASILMAASSVGTQNNAPPSTPASKPPANDVAQLQGTQAMTGMQAMQPLPSPNRSQPPALHIPVQGISATDLRDTYDQGRDGNTRGHEAIDILAPRGTPVLAVDGGRIVKLFTSKPGGLTIYQFDATGQFTYYYAHLDSYAPGLAEGQTVSRGSVIGYVGYTGNANPAAPHLHFAIFRLGPEKQWWKGEPLNPFGSLGGIER